MKPRMPNSAPEMPVTSTPFAFAPTVESLEDGDAMDCRRQPERQHGVGLALQRLLRQ